MMVPIARPLMMVTAIAEYIGSVISGSIPRMVVRLAIITGRVRLTVAFTTASYGCIPSSVSRVISSTSTMPFFTIIPISPMKPMIAMNVNGEPLRNSAGAMPQSVNGKHIRMSITFFH